MNCRLQYKEHWILHAIFRPIDKWNVRFKTLKCFFCQWAWPWSYDCWIYNYLCNQCLSPLKLWVRTQLRRGVLDTTLCDKVCQLFATGRWFSPGTPVSSTNKTDRHDITEMLLKVALITIKLTKPMSAFNVVPNFLYLFLICLTNMY